jgi:hypothetical protein
LAALDIADAVVGAATATAGLVLVFLGAVSASYERYLPQERRPALKARYRLRGGVAFAGLILAVASAVFGLIAKWMQASSLTVAAFGLLTVSLGFVLYAAYLSLSEIE